MAPYADLPSVKELDVFKKLSSLNPAKASGLDCLPGWLLKENADLLAPVVTSIIKPTKVDPGRFGTVPGSSTTEALASMVHAWNRAKDGNGAVVRVVLFDFR